MNTTTNTIRAKKALTAVALVVTVLVSTFCSDDEMVHRSYPAAGEEETTVQLSWSVAGIVAGDDLTSAAMNAASATSGLRTIPSDMGAGGAYSDETPVVQNMWIIQFDGNTASAKMLGAPRFLSADDLPAAGAYPLTVSIPLMQKSNSCFTLFVANIREGNQYNWNLTPESTFADAATRVKTLADESGSYEDFLPGKTLLLSAVTDSPIEAGIDLTPVFTRNVAKATLNLKLSNTDMAITSVRIKNVSNGIVYADAALAVLGMGTAAADVCPASVALMHYPAITDAGEMPLYGETKSYSWYVPRNQQGVAALSTSARTKNIYAPTNATYFEITAIKKDAANNPVATSVFRIYPGADMTKDFNLISNNHYTVALDVVDIGTDVADSRVQTFAKDVDYSGSGTKGDVANAFILNPAPAQGGISRTYRIPISQVNRYWGGTDPGYGNNPLHLIGAADNWVIEMIWSDLPELFSTVPSATAITLSNNNGRGIGVGQGPNECFMLNVPAGLPAGNFTLGIKRAGGDRYLWSWHFWVTDYNPDSFNFSLISEGTYTYPVPGGQVERYAAPASGTNVWTGTGVYARKVMMDRSLGAVENFFTTQPASANRGILHYQFGRKDPFPPIGNISGVSTLTGSAISIATGPVTVAETVTYPCAFYISSSGNWCGEAEVNATTYSWHDPAAKTNTYAKSIYDPCPPGWQVPVNGTWGDLGRQVDGQYITTQNHGRDLGWNYGRGIGSIYYSVNGLRYWPGTTAAASTGGTIWYPCLGFREQSSGVLSTIGTGGYYWTSNPSNTANSYNLRFTSGNTSTSYTLVRAYGFSIRCVAE